jgi:hypothetical protein
MAARGVAGLAPLLVQPDLDDDRGRRRRRHRHTRRFDRPAGLRHLLGRRGLASVIVIWRFTGSRALSETSERRAQKAVAVSFWLLVPYVVADALYKLLVNAEVETSYLGIGLTASSLVLMPLL